jgi:hypothetical protein
MQQSTPQKSEPVDVNVTQEVYEAWRAHNHYQCTALARKHCRKISVICVHREEGDPNCVIRLHGPGELTREAKVDVEAWISLDEPVHEHVWGAFDENKRWRCNKLAHDCDNRIHVHCVDRNEDDDTAFVIRLCGPAELVRKAQDEIKAWKTMQPIYVRHTWCHYFTGHDSKCLFGLKEGNDVHAFMENKREGCNHFVICGHQENAIIAFADALMLRHVPVAKRHQDMWVNEETGNSCVRDDQVRLGNEHFKRDKDNICKNAFERFDKELGFWRVVLGDSD